MVTMALLRCPGSDQTVESPKGIDHTTVLWCTHCDTHQRVCPTTDNGRATWRFYAHPARTPVVEPGPNWPATSPTGADHLSPQQCPHCGQTCVPDSHGNLRHPTGSTSCLTGPQG
jgi:hypothetical protein